MVKRVTYLSKIHTVKNNETIKIIYGVKRSGKSTLISQFIEELQVQRVKKEQIIYLNFELPNFKQILNTEQEWFHTLEETFTDDLNYYVFLDELPQIGMIIFPLIKKLRARKNVDLYMITSNNTFLPELIDQAAAELTLIHVFPFSFREFLSGYKFEFQASTINYWKAFLLSSFPHATTLRKDSDRLNYLSDLVDGILVNELMFHVSTTNIQLLKYLTQFLVQNVGHELSTNKIATQLSCSLFPKVYPKMVDKYINGLLDTFLFYKINRYDINEKQIVTTASKYYLADIGLQTINHARNEKALATAAQNIVLLELKKRGYEVFFGKIGNQKIDFVAKKDDYFEYYQVSHLPFNPVTLAHKKRPVDKLRDGYSRFFLTLDTAGVRGNYDGLRHMSIFEWLMQSEG